MLDSRMAAPQTSGPLTIVPLVALDALDAPWTLLADAIADGTLRITEIGGGTVPRVLAKNAGSKDVLVLDGEQLIGARQNRMTNRSILLAAFTETEIPVSCMEQGRWRFASDSFQPAPQHSPTRVRRKAREVEAAALSDGDVPTERHLAEAQGDVWDEISALAHDLRVHSPTGALDDAYRSLGSDIGGRVRFFPLVPGQIGFIGLVHGEAIGLDVLAAPSLYARVHERLVRGYIVDALHAALGSPGHVDPSVPGGPESTGTDGSAGAGRFVEAVRSTARTASPSAGIGRYSVLNGDVIGGELLNEAMEPHRLVHLSAFPAIDHGRSGRYYAFDAPIAPPSERRRQ